MGCESSFVLWGAFKKRGWGLSTVQEKNTTYNVHRSSRLDGAFNFMSECKFQGSRAIRLVERQKLRKHVERTLVARIYVYCSLLNFFCTMITPVHLQRRRRWSIWQPKRSRCCLIRLIVRIWLLMIFGCFQNWRNCSEMWCLHKWGHPLAQRPVIRSNSLKHFRSGSNVGRSDRTLGEVHWSR